MLKTRSSRAAVRSRKGERLDTRALLLEAAGHVFAQKGFDRATGKEICAKAGTNAAAINYHFGGIDALYAAVLHEANGRLFTVERLAAVVAGRPDAKSRFEAIIAMIVETITGSAASSWAFRVIGREVVAPSPVFEEFRDKEILPKARLFRGVVAELMGLPIEHPAVARGCITIIAPCILVLIADRRVFKRAFPEFGLAPSDAGTLTEHMMRYALAGLEAIARAAKHEC
jgi:AcrR family transcriptional regulator